MATLKAVKDEIRHTTRTGVSLADLLGKSRTVDVPFPGGLSLSVTYDPGKVTARALEFDLITREDQQEELARVVRNNEATARAICKIVQSWDLTDCPVGPGHEDEVASTVPDEVLSTILRAIREDNSLVPRQETRRSSS